MTPPNGYIPVGSAAIHAAGLADQPMLYWREEWDGPRVLRLSDSECPQWAMGAYVRDSKALRDGVANAQRQAQAAWDAQNASGLVMQRVAFGNHGQTFRDRHVNLYGEPILGPRGLGPIR